MTTTSSSTPRASKLAAAIQYRERLRGFTMPEDARDALELAFQLETDLAAMTARVAELERELAEMAETNIGNFNSACQQHKLRVAAEARALAAAGDAKRWRGVEHAMQHVSLTQIAGEPTTFDPRDVKHLVSMRQFVDSTIERHIAKIQAAIDAAGRK